MGRPRDTTKDDLKEAKLTSVDVPVLYYGKIKDLVGKDREVITFEGKTHLRDFFEELYPALDGVDFKVVFNDVLTEVLDIDAQEEYYRKNPVLRRTAKFEIVLLPSFVRGLESKIEL